jgi:TetR/AcrR family transcriptional regulator, ethionamide resistance regulator
MRVNLEARAAIAEQRRAKTRERLLDAASAVIAEKGPDATSIEEIVAAAGVSRGTFYNYFPTTDDLVHALNARTAEAFLAPMRELVARLDDPAMRLSAAAHFTLMTMVADPTRAWVMLRLEGARAPRNRPAGQFLTRLFQEGIAARRFEVIDLEAARAVTIGALRMAAREVLMDDAPHDLTDHVVATVLLSLGMPLAIARQASADGRAIAAAFCAEGA